LRYNPFHARNLIFCFHFIIQVALQKPVSFNDLEDAEQTVRVLDSICRELPNRREDAEKLTDNSATTRSIRAGIEKISVSVPKRVRFLKERLDKLEAFRSDLGSAEDFCRESETMLEETKSRNDEASKQVYIITRFFLLSNVSYD
jgi:hypothetical protein